MFKRPGSKVTNKLTRPKMTTTKFANDKGEFKRKDSSSEVWITKDGSSGFPAESGRYHLYVSYAYPWAHRTIITRYLKGLTEVISLDVVDYLMGEKGWRFNPETPGATPDSLYGFEHIREVYFLAQKDYEGQFSVPVLWDKKKTIVNNESSEILRMLNSEFNEFCATDEARAVDLYPENLKQEIDGLNEWIYRDINNGVYRAGFATAQEAYDKAVRELFASLDKVEEILSSKRYLTGSTPDIRLFTTLVRFDRVYVGHFKCKKKRIVDYPNIWGYLRDLYQTKGFGETTNLFHIVHGYQVGLLSLNSTDSLNLIPMVRIPLNASGCSSAPPTIRNTTLVNTCQVMSLVAKSTSPIDIDDIQCNSSRSPNCTTISCTVPRTDDAITFEFEPCIFNPPAIAVRNSVNGQVRQQHNIEETTTFNNFVLGGKTVSLTVTLVEHSMVKSIGFKVDISVSNSSSREFIPYREIPFDPSKCPHAPRLSPTCRTMTNIAQYMMFFVANSTLSMEDTPDCHPDRKLLCNSIDCIMPGSSHAYKGTFLVCQDPVAFQVVHTFDGDVVEDTTYTLSSLISLKDGVSAQMTLDNLDNHTVQFRIYQETLGGDLVPSVKVPLDNRSCRPTPPVTTAPPSSSETTGTGGTDEPDSVPSLLLIEIAAPIGVISILVILALTIVICTLCFKQKKLSNDPYSFKPLTDQEAVEDAENGDN